jgi:uncharacterized protein
MILEEDQAEGQFHIRSYKPGEIALNERIYTQSLILSRDTLIPDWRPQTLAEIQESDWDPILALKPQFLLFGSGSRFTLPPDSLFARLYENHISVDVMDSAAACRTYMAILNENRNMAAAILIK